MFIILTYIYKNINKVYILNVCYILTFYMAC